MQVVGGGDDELSEVVVGGSMISELETGLCWLTWEVEPVIGSGCSDLFSGGFIGLAATTAVTKIFLFRKTFQW